MREEFDSHFSVCVMKVFAPSCEHVTACVPVVLLFFCFCLFWGFFFYFKAQHFGKVMKDDSFPFLIAMVPVA